MRSFLEQYGTAIFTLVLVAILIAFAGPLGLIIKKSTNDQIKNVDNVGTEEIVKVTDGISNDDSESGDVQEPTEAVDYVYACLYEDGELVISNNQITPQKSVFNNGNFGKVDISSIPKWTSMYGNTFSSQIKCVTFLNKIKPTNCKGWFTSCRNLVCINNIKYLDTSSATSMYYMFNQCYELTNLDVSHFNTSNVENMAAMFKDCSLLTSIDVSNFNTSKVIDMQLMFNSCEKLKEINLSSFDTKNVKYMNNMFEYDYALETINFETADLSKLTSKNSMFSNCSRLKNIITNSIAKEQLLKIDTLPNNINWTIK